MGRSWPRLGVNFDEILLVFVLFRGKRRFRKKSSQDPSWADLGPIWVAKRGPRRGLLETKLGSKGVRKSEAKKGLVLRRLGGGGTRPDVRSL